MKYSFFGANIFCLDDNCKLISGDCYKRLVQICCQYSYAVSFINMHNNAPLFDLLQPYQIDPDPQLFDYSVNYYLFGSQIQPYKIFYRICPEICEIMINNADSIFDWYGDKPEDPTFYRKDGSIFFYCQAHDDMCMINPQPREDVSEIVNQIGWVMDNYN